MDVDLKILVLIPMKPNLHAALKDICMENAFQMSESIGDLIDIVIDDSGSGDSHVSTLMERTMHTSTIRNNMVTNNLKPKHTHVVWIDADVIHYPSDIALHLARLSHCRHAVTAPAVYLHNKNVIDVDRNYISRRWYDTAGFVKNTLKFDVGFPYFHGMTFRDYKNPVLLDGVGCVYCVPAPVYRNNKDLHVPRLGYTEHLSVCEKAREMGYSIMCDFSIDVEHAYLPDYGEKNH